MSAGCMPGSFRMNDGCRQFDCRVENPRDGDWQCLSGDSMRGNVPCRLCERKVDRKLQRHGSVVYPAISWGDTPRIPNSLPPRKTPKIQKKKH